MNFSLTLPEPSTPTVTLWTWSLPEILLPLNYEHVLPRSHPRLLFFKYSGSALPLPQKTGVNQDSKPLDPSSYICAYESCSLVYLSTLDSMVYYGYYFIISLNYHVPLPPSYVLRKSTSLDKPQCIITSLRLTQKTAQQFSGELIHSS